MSKGDWRERGQNFNAPAAAVAAKSRNEALFCRSPGEQAKWLNYAQLEPIVELLEGSPRHNRKLELLRELEKMEDWGPEH